MTEHHGMVGCTPATSSVLASPLPHHGKVVAFVTQVHGGHTVVRSAVAAVAAAERVRFLVAVLAGHVSASGPVWLVYAGSAAIVACPLRAALYSMNERSWLNAHETCT